MKKTLSIATMGEDDIRSQEKCRAAIVDIQCELDQCYGDLVVLNGFFEHRASRGEANDIEDVDHFIGTAAKMLGGIYKNVRAALDAANDVA